MLPIDYYKRQANNLLEDWNKHAIKETLLYLKRILTRKALDTLSVDNF